MLKIKNRKIIKYTYTLLALGLADNFLTTFNDLTLIRLVTFLLGAYLRRLTGVFLDLVLRLVLGIFLRFRFIFYYKIRKIKRMKNENKK